MMVGSALILLVVVIPLVAAWMIGSGSPTRWVRVSVDQYHWSALRSARRRGLISIAVAAGAFLLALTSAGTGLGLGAALAPSVAVTAGLLVYAATPAAGKRVGTVRTASLEPRRWWSFVPPGPALLWGVAAVLLVGSVIWFGNTAVPDSFGLSRAFGRADGVGGSATAGPYPGWYYGVPIAIGALVLAVVTGVGIWRVSLWPALPGPTLEAADSRWRSRSCEVVLLLSAASLWAQLAGIWFMGGQAIRSVAWSLSDPGSRLVAVGSVVALLGTLAALLTAVMVGAAIRRALALPAASLGTLVTDDHS